MVIATGFSGPETLGPFIEGKIPVIWMFLLLTCRYLGLLLFLPGLGSGASGIAIRYPAVIALSWASLQPDLLSEVPSNLALLVLAMMSELILGTIIGFVPRLVVAGVNSAGQFVSTAMGLNAGQVIDPTTASQSTEIGRILGDIAVLMFLFMGGERAMIYLASGAKQGLFPGVFVIEEITIDFLIRETGNVITMGVLLSAPVVVALLLVQLIMGIISKAVSTVNVFVVSFPITVGVGLTLLLFSIASIIRVTEKEFKRLEIQIFEIIVSQQKKSN